LRQARTRNSFVYGLTGPDGGERWYLIHRGQVRAVCFTPSTDEERARAAGLRRGPDGDGAALRDPWGTAITLVSG
jgi:hypothetical protein